MATVLIQPSIGNRASRERWRETMARPVDFEAAARAQHLTAVERAALRLFHPDGKAPFWGLTSTHDSKAAKLRQGDIALFTGQNRAFAVAQVGAVFRNQAFADSLWQPGKNDSSWHNVYSLLNVEPIEVPYEELAPLCGYKANYVFQGALILKGDIAPRVLDALRISPGLLSNHGTAPSNPVAPATTADESGPLMVPVERYVTESTVYQREPGTTLVDRAEGRLVNAYLATLPSHTSASSLVTKVGRSDILTVGPEGRELIEAKSKAHHFYVRQALGQLLDYASHSEDSLDRLTVLLPELPGDHSLTLLSRYGIDCLYQQKPKAFARIEAPSANRNKMRQIWS